MLRKVVNDFSALLDSQGTQVLQNLMHFFCLAIAFVMQNHFHCLEGCLKFNNCLQLGHFLKKILKGNTGCLSKREFIEAITLYLNQRHSLASNEFSKLCTCGGKRDSNQHNVNYSANHVEIIDAQQKELEV